MRLVIGAVLLFFYLVPLFKIKVGVLRFFPVLDKYFVYEKVPSSFKPFLKFLAIYEYYLYPFRRVIGGLSLWVLFACSVYHASLTPALEQMHVWEILFLAALLVLHYWTQIEKDRVNVRMMEYLRVRPNLHPEEFFDRYRRQLALSLGGLGNDLKEDYVSTKDADFRKHVRSDLKRSLVLKGLWDTIQIADICLSVLSRVGPRYLYENVDVMASMASKRLLQRCQASLEVHGTEKLEGLNGKFIFVFNHESSLDFMLSFFSLSEVTLNGRHPRPRFIVAKDHFKDNPIVYKFFGIGRVVEAMDMIFIDRKNRKKGHQNLKQAAQALVSKDVDLAIYPQGTRAPGTFDRAGKRRPAGYYTTVNKKAPHVDCSYIRKGTAYLLLDILLELYETQRQDDVFLVFVGVQGASVTLPKKHWRVQTETEISFQIGDVLKLNAEQIPEIFPEGFDSELTSARRREFVNKMTKVIDDRLKTTLGLHEKLSKRFVMDLRGQFRHYDQDKMSQIEEALRQAQAKDDQIFQILDRIYTLPSKEWNGYLSQLCQLLLGKPEPDRMTALLQEVTEKMLKI